MNNQEAKLILQAYRLGGQDAADPLFQEVLEQLKRDPDLAKWFATPQNPLAGPGENCSARRVVGAAGVARRSRIGCSTGRPRHDLVEAVKPTAIRRLSPGDGPKCDADDRPREL